jgi:malonate decarboxylase beta subunit
MSIEPDIGKLLKRDSFIERNARSRAQALLDAGSMRELVGPFDRVTSPWLAQQNIVTQADDGVVVAKGTFDGVATVVLAIEGAFQGGSMGEVGGAKIAGALELAARDNRHGIPTQAVLLFETGGVRLQEANLGLAAIAEIQSAIVDLRRYRPVIGVSAGTVGCYGGMSIAAGLCSYLVLTREARLGLNGPQVIEQEAGVGEFDSRNRGLIWALTGGEQRCATQLADVLVDDDTAQVRATLADLFRAGPPAVHRSERHADFLGSLEHVDTARQPDAADVRTIYGKGLA